MSNRRIKVDARRGARRVGIFLFFFLLAFSFPCRADDGVEATRDIRRRAAESSRYAGDGRRWCAGRAETVASIFMTVIRPSSRCWRKSVSFISFPFFFFRLSSFHSTKRVATMAVDERVVASLDGWRCCLNLISVSSTTTTTT